MLARNAVMLYMVSELDAAPEDALAVWVNHGLTEDQAELVRLSCRALAEQPWPKWLAASSYMDLGSWGGGGEAGRQGEGAGEAAGKVAQSAAGGGGVDEGEPAAAGGEGGGVGGEVSAAGGKGLGVGREESAAGGGSEVPLAMQQIRAACAAWAACTMPLTEMLRLREEILHGSGGVAHALELSLSAVSSSINKSSSSNSSGMKTASNSAGQYKKEVADYIRSGSLPSIPCSSNSSSSSSSSRSSKSSSSTVAAQSQANPTFLLAPELQYTVYFSSSIFRAVHLAAPGPAAAAGGGGAGSKKAASGAAAAGSKHATATQLLVAAVVPQIQAVAEALKGGQLQVTLVPGDVLAVATAVTPFSATSVGDSSTASRKVADGAALFDFIDTSNVSDYT